MCSPRTQLILPFGRPESGASAVPGGSSAVAAPIHFKAALSHYCLRVWGAPRRTGVHGQKSVDEGVYGVTSLS